MLFRDQTSFFYVYLALLDNGVEKLYKVGYTGYTPEKRIENSIGLPLFLKRHIKLINYIAIYSKKDALDVEKYLLKLLTKYKYDNIVSFTGSTEALDYHENVKLIFEKLKLQIDTKYKVYRDKQIKGFTIDVCDLLNEPIAVGFYDIVTFKDKFTFVIIENEKIIDNKSPFAKPLTYGDVLPYILKKDFDDITNRGMSIFDAWTVYIKFNNELIELTERFKQLLFENYGKSTN